MNQIHTIIVAHFKVVLIEAPGLNEVPALLKKEKNASNHTLKCDVPMIDGDIR